MPVYDPTFYDSRRQPAPATSSSTPSRRRSSGHTAHRSEWHSNLAPRPTPMPTGYGLNEPQWSGDRDAPPPINFARSPYARVPLPDMHTQVALNPFLRPPKPDRACIRWDVTRNPNFETVVPPQSNVSSYHPLAAPAMSPADLPSLTIRVRPYVTPIVIMAKSNGPGRILPITVGDVLRGVYVGLRRASTEHRMATHNIDPELLWSAIANFEGAEGVFEDPAVGRKDALCSSVTLDLDFNVYWFGLVPSQAERDVFVLQTWDGITRK